MGADIASGKIATHSEVSLHGPYVQKILVEALGCRGPIGNDQYDVTQEQSITRGSVDVAIGAFAHGEGRIVAPFELKGVETLHDLGHETILIASGGDALKVLEKDDLRFDVVFTDVMMPGMSGVELAQTVRARYPGLPVLLTSGYSEIIAKEGTFGFPLLRKPYSVEALSRALRQALRQ